MAQKAQADDFLGRFREVISDPLNLLIERVPLAGVVENSEVYLHNGNRVPIAGSEAYYGSFSELLILNRGVHEPLEEYVFQQVLRRLGEEPMMIELGAYWGHYSMWLKKIKPHAAVILVEPEAENLTAGMKNFERNGFRGKFIKDTVGHNGLIVDKFLKENSYSHLDILHSDIQGYEMEMLDGCVSSLQNRQIDYLLISTHSQDLHHQVEDALAKFGYRVEVSSDFDNDTTSYDGFILSSRPDLPAVFDNFKPLGRSKITQSRPEELVKSLLHNHSPLP
jgi:hypothetical protein